MSANGSSSSSCFHAALIAIFVGGLVWVSLRAGAPHKPNMPGVVAIAKPEIPAPVAPPETPAVPATPSATETPAAPQNASDTAAAPQSADAWK